MKKICGKKPDLLYNRIDLKRFSSGISLNSLPKPLIISVGRLTQQKNHQCIIEAMKQIDANLLIIGDGELYEKLMKIILEEKLDKKIMIKKSVPNQEIQNYYKSAVLFALAYDTNLEGLPIPVMEAMACGLPIIIPFPKQGYSDGLEDNVLFSKPNPTSFAQKINKILKNKNLIKDLSKKSLNKSKEFDETIIEKKEAEIYRKLLSIKNDY